MAAEITPATRPASPPVPDPSPSTADVGTLAARLSPPELEELAAALSDDDLARLMLASVRQFRRRLGRPDRRGGKAPASALERAARQLAAELGQEEMED